MPSEKRVIIVGGGLAGLMTAVTACEKGASVDLVSYVPVRRSHSVCAQGGINGAVNTKGEGDSPEFHFDDTIYGGDFLANQLKPETLQAAAAAAGHPLTLRMQPGYDHSYYFISSFIENHLRHHAAALAAMSHKQ